MKSRYVSILFIFFFGIFGFAQSVNLVGNIIIDNVDEPMDLSQVIIVNKQTEEVAKSNEAGNFQIRVNLNDELIFRSGFTIPRSIKINEVIINKGFLNMHLDLEIVQLSEAVIDPLKPNLKDNFSKGDTSGSTFYKSLGLDPNLQYVEVNPNATSTINHNGWTNDPALWIASITGQRKRDVKKDKFFKKANKIDDIKEYFTSDYFTDELKIPDYKIIEFLNYCSSSSNIVNLFSNSRLEEVQMHLENCASKYVDLLKSNQK